MTWEINYFNEPLEENILSLPENLLARYLKLTDLMIKHGPNLGSPHTEPLGNGLFELRLKERTSFS